jgi:hypothetical protein
VLQNEQMLCVPSLTRSLQKRWRYVDSDATGQRVLIFERIWLLYLAAVCVKNALASGVRH